MSTTNFCPLKTTISNNSFYRENTGISVPSVYGKLNKYSYSSWEILQVQI